MIVNRDSLDVLNKLVYQLEKDYERINNWIKSHPASNINFAELTDCIARYGELSAKYDEFYKKYDLPRYDINRSDGSNELPLVFPEMRVARDNLQEMVNLRAGSELFRDETAKRFMNELLYSATTAQYNQPEKRSIQEAKKSVLFTLASVYFYTWDTKQREPEYVYDNVSEWNALKSNYETYKNAVGIEEQVQKDDGSSYEGPQFGNIIEEMMDRVEKNKIMNDFVERNQDIRGSELYDLNFRAYNLKNSYKNINNYIQDNMNTVPNFREMVDSVIEYGKLISQFASYYNRNGYPIIEDEGREASNYEIAVVNQDVRDVQEGIYQMMQLRGNHQFFSDPTARAFMNELANASAVGGYYISEDSQVDNLKKEILCQVAAIYFYIWYTKQREPNYVYDNVSEWDALNEKYALYKELVGVQERRANDDYSVYEGPQFGRIIEDMLDGIKKNSVLQNENISESHK